MPAPRLPVPLTDEMRAWVEAEAERRMCSQAQVVRGLIDKEMERQRRAREEER